MKIVRTYIYKNIGEQRDIDGVGRVNAGEEIAIPETPLNDPLLQLINTEESEQLEDGEVPEETENETQEEQTE